MNLDPKRQTGQTSICSMLPGVSAQTSIILGFLFLTACQGTPEFRAPSDMLTTTTPPPNVSDQELVHRDAPLSKRIRIQPDTEAKPPTMVGNSDNLEPWLSTIHVDFALARRLVEKELQVDLSNIDLKLVDNTPINAEVALETKRLVKEQFGHSDFADQFLQQVMAPLAGTYAALYSSRLSAVMISRSMLASYERSVIQEQPASSKRAALLTLLIHELVHAADDLRYRIHDNRALNFRASFAQSATFEGHAQWATRRICEKAGCSDGLRALDNFMFSTDTHSTQLTQPVEAISRSVLEYSYVEGERFVARLATRENGKQLIDDLLSSPPLDPIQILAPDTYPDIAREHRNQRLIQTSRNVDHPLTGAPWIGVETSPLKGVDLRSDPTRRQAAIDGFTQLIQGMISMQFYDQQSPGAMPIETTILKAESAHTARLFATMLHSNTQQADAWVEDEPLLIRPDTSSTNQGVKLHIYRTAIDADTSYRTSIAVSGEHVVQVSGNTANQAFLDDFAIGVLIDLSQS
ncbi:MAG: hypothetical protein AB8B87_03400 [Granulosicoccus sp.]